MSFVDRAISEYERGNPPRAALMLANGLRREPDNERALNYLLKIYVEDIDRVGMERDVLRILELQPDGLELYELVETRLAELEASTRLTALQRTRARAQMLPEPNIERVPIGNATTSSKLPAVKEAPRRVGRGEDAAHESNEYREQAFADDARSSGQMERDRDEVVSEERDLDDERSTSDWDRVEVPRGRPKERAEDFVRTPATTGVFSTLDAVVREDSERELHEWYRRRNTRRILTGVFVLACIFVGLFVVWPMLSKASEQPETEAPATPEDSTDDGSVSEPQEAGGE